jgi:pyruvate-formate lyase-activating enzyme
MREKQFVIELTRSCDLECLHCSTRSSPKVKSSLDPAVLRGVLQQISEVAPGGVVGLTGGEVFHVRDLLYEAIAMIRELGLRYAVITNGSWATDAAERRRVLVSILDATLLELSSDVYHAAVVPKHVIGQAFREALALGICAQIRYTYTSAESFSDVCDEMGLATEEERSLVQFNPVHPIGRGARLHPAELPPRPAAEPCLAASRITVHSSGRIYGCCGESAYVPGDHDLSYGDAGSVRLTEIIRGRDHDPVLQAIRTIGPQRLLQISAASHRRAGDEQRADSPCGACRILLRTENAAPVRAAAANIERRTRMLRAAFYGEVASPPAG